MWISPRLHDAIHVKISLQSYIYIVYGDSLIYLDFIDKHK